MGLPRKGQFVSLARKKSFKNLTLTNQQKEIKPEIIIGRRIVELSVIIEALKKCSGCPEPLNIVDIFSETCYGLGSILHVRCRSCGLSNNIPTGKRHSATVNAKKWWREMF